MGHYKMGEGGNGKELSPVALHFPALTAAHRSLACRRRRCHDDLLTLAGAPELPPGRRGRISRQISLELCASYVYLSTSYRFDRHDAALKNFAKYFLHQSPEEREHAEKLMKLQNQRGGPIFLQDIEKPDRDDWESGKIVGVHRKGSLMSCVNQSPLELRRLATDKNDSRLCDFIETHYLDKRVKSIKQLGDHVTNLRKMRALQSGVAEYLFDKHTLGDHDNES
ncbi:Ferritin heavy chain [Heterocephalus glaber]|uniref:Ferritin n=1 Tax=Heterocephalus glaber TaxID=10181 RepID=G5BVW0_HETGA|nr:Ferritin heavy chain [Heterocephalus glaber]